MRSSERVRVVLAPRADLFSRERVSRVFEHILRGTIWEVSRKEEVWDSLAKKRIAGSR